MLKYTLKRLLIIPPTILGIIIITFVLVHLAPGDPVAAMDSTGSMRSAATAEAIEANRRLFFLHLPLLINGDIEDAPEIIDRSIDVALSARYLESIGREAAGLRVREKALARLTAKGTAVAPYVFVRVADLAEVFSPEQLTKLLRSAAGDAAVPPDGSDPGTYDWSSFDFVGWWNTTGSAVFNPDAAEAAVDALMAAPGDPGPGADPTRPWVGAVDPAVVKRVEILGRYAVPWLIDAVDGSTREAGRASELLSDFMRREVTFKPGAPDDEVDAVLDDWDEWWYQNELEYRNVRGFYTVTGFFTQTQFFKWASRVVMFNFGNSTHDGRPVLTKVAEALPVTLMLSVLAVFFAYTIAVPVGIYSAVRRDTPGERVTTVILFILYSLPNFWAAVMLMFFLGNPDMLEILPIIGLQSFEYDTLSTSGKILDRLHHLILPVFCLTYASLAALSRYQRVAMLDVIRQDYIRTARAKGLEEKVVVYKHALRNALIPIITLLGLHLPLLIGGSVIIEKIFTIPGMGLLAFNSLLNRDYPVIMAIATFTGILTMLGVLASDLLYAAVDPRISYSND